MPTPTGGPIENKTTRKMKKIVMRPNDCETKKKTTTTAREQTIVKSNAWRNVCFTLLCTLLSPRNALNVQLRLAM